MESSSWQQQVISYNYLLMGLALQVHKRDIISMPPVTLDLTGGMFGTIASKRIPMPTGMDFIPLDNQGTTLKIRGEDAPHWLGLHSKSMQYWAYQYCSPLAGVIDRLAEADSNGRIAFYHDSDKKKVENVNKIPKLSRIAKLMKNPNPLQTWEEFNSEQVVYAKIFGYCPVLCVVPKGMDKSFTKWMFNLNPLFCTPTNYDEVDVFADNFTSNIDYWTIKLWNRNIEISGDDILVVKDGFIDNDGDGLPMSKLCGLDFAISNICAAMEADNVLLRKKGPLGIFSYDPKPDNVAGYLPMTNLQKDELQGELKRYGLSLNMLQYIISRSPIKWNPVSFDTTQLKTKETIQQGTDIICDRLGYPAELMSGKNATYENRHTSERFLYQNNIIPFSLRRMARYDQFFGLEEYTLLQDFLHIAVLQEDIQKASLALKDRTIALDMQWKSNLISYNEYRVELKYDKIAGKDKYFYTDYTKENEVSPEDRGGNAPVSADKLPANKDGNKPKPTGQKSS
jgi:hypothetical protein